MGTLLDRRYHCKATELGLVVYGDLIIHRRITGWEKRE
jgi:hypothetical protein